MSSLRSRRNKSSDDLAALAIRRSAALASGGSIACSLPVECGGNFGQQQQQRAGRRGSLGGGGGGQQQQDGSLDRPGLPGLPTVVVSACSSKESSARSQIPPLPEIPEEHLE